jgi:hypothetical protein
MHSSARYNGQQTLRKVRQMRPEDILVELRRQPFVPLLLRLSNGREYTVRHPDLVFVGRSSINVGTPAPDLPAGVYDHYEIVSLLHLARIIPMPTTSPPKNGPPA